MIIQRLDDDKELITIIPEVNFSSKRLIVADFVKTELSLRSAVKEVFNEKLYLFPPNFKMIIQIIDELEGGLSSTEKRAFIDCAEQVGAVEVYLLITKNIFNKSQLLQMLENPAVSELIDR